ncbi:NCS1 family nucleobase:cation symporter-1 [Sulfurisphaera javensis]|uniref:NCS1 family nucleobase:cation symporter-1 n=1 Tax=Sulfurisphaera javensis TaxID=2049879 RepID=A0AAT9GSZ5_9CREN
MKSKDDILSNEEILPIPKEIKKWSALDYSMAWVTMTVGVLAWEYPWFGIFLGIPWYLSVSLVFLGNLITLIPMLIQSHAGAKYGIAEPQITRSRWGIWGAFFPSAVRAIIGAGWWGINVFIITEIIVGLYLKFSGQLNKVIIPLLSNGSANSFTISLAVPQLFWITFAIVIISELLLLYISPILKGQEPLRKMSKIVGPLSIISLLILFLYEGETSGWNLSNLGKFTVSTSNIFLLLAFLAGNMSSWLTMAISMPDLTRFAKSQRSQMLGQIILPFIYSFAGLLGVLGTTMAISNVHATVIDPVLLTLLTTPSYLSLIILIPILMETFGVNTLANLLPPGYDISNFYPKRINWFTGVIIATIIGLLIGAWSFLGSAYGFMINWLNTYGIALGGIVGINVADYVFVRKFTIDVESLYVRNGSYKYYHGINLASILAFTLSILPGYSYVLGLSVSSPLYSLGPMLSLPLGILLYLLFMKLFKYW